MKNRPPTWNGIEIPYALSVDELRQAANGSESTSWPAFVALAHHPDDSALEILREKAADKDPYVRRIAIEAIGVHPRGFLFADVVSRLLTDPFGPVVRSACEAAATHKMTGCHALIIRLLISPEEHTVEAALSALQSLWRAEDFPLVLNLFKASRIEDVRKCAAWTLRTAASGENWRNLYDVWRSDFLPRHRAWACELAAKFGGPDEKIELARLSEDPDGHVRTHALRALAGIGVPRHS